MTAEPDTMEASAAARVPGLALYCDVATGLPADLSADLLQPPLRDPKVRYRDLSVDDELRARLLAVVDDMLRGGQLLMGPAVVRWEELIAGYCGARHCVGVASGTSALYLALKAFDIGPGDEVIVPAMSWVATANAVAVAGATPVFVDIADDLNIDVADAEAAITPRTRAILPVHYTGRLCDMAALRALVDRHGLELIEDAAQAFGATTEDGRRAGSFGDAAAFSLNPMKVFPSYGEVGAVLVNDPQLDARLRALRYLGTVDKEICVEPSLNHKIDTLQAAMMLVSYERLEPTLLRRVEIAARYCAGLNGIVGCPQPPRSPQDRRSVFFDFTVTSPRRTELRRFLESRGIEAKIRHPLLMSQQPAYRQFATRPLPNAERLVGQIISLPIHEKLTDAQVDEVIAAVAEFCG